MADLSPISSRLNDVEISSNAPQTETLWRRVGSNVNFLLDFLGIANGETTPSGDLQDLITAISTVSGHTISLEATINNGNATTNVGTFPSVKFLDRVFYYRISTSYTAGLFIPRKNVDGNGTVGLYASKTTPASVSGTGGSKPLLGSTGITFNEVAGGALTTPVVQGTAYRSINTGVGGTDYEDIMRAGEWVILGTLDWREGTSTVVEIEHQTGASAGSVYMGYKLNIESAPLVFP